MNIQNRISKYESKAIKCMEEGEIGHYNWFAGKAAGLRELLNEKHEVVRKIIVKPSPDSNHTYTIEIGKLGVNSRILRDGKLIPNIEEATLRINCSEIPELILRERLL